MSNSFIYHVYNIYNYYVQELIILMIFIIDFRYKLSNENQRKNQIWRTRKTSEFGDRFLRDKNREE